MTEDRAGEVQNGRDPFTTIPNWLLEPGVSTPNEKAVLLALKFHGDQSFPSHQTIADRAGCSRRTAIDTIKAMAAKGWLSWTERKSEKGQTSNLYELHLWRRPPVQELHTPLCNSCTPPVQELHTNKTQLTRLN